MINLVLLILVQVQVRRGHVSTVFILILHRLLLFACDDHLSTATHSTSPAGVIMGVWVVASCENRAVKILKDEVLLDLLFCIFEVANPAVQIWARPSSRRRGPTSSSISLSCQLTFEGLFRSRITDCRSSIHIQICLVLVTFKAQVDRLRPCSRMSCQSLLKAANMLWLDFVGIWTTSASIAVVTSMFGTSELICCGYGQLGRVQKLLLCGSIICVVGQLLLFLVFNDHCLHSSCWHTPSSIIVIIYCWEGRRVVLGRAASHSSRLSFPLGTCARIRHHKVAQVTTIIMVMSLAIVHTNNTLSSSTTVALNANNLGRFRVWTDYLMDWAL